MGSSDQRAGACAAEKRPASCDLCAVRERSICADLGPRELAQIEKTMARRTVAKSHALMEEGSPNDSLYIIVQGSFRLTKHLEDGRRQVTGFLFPGDFMGVRATPASAYTAEALEDSRVCHFPHKFLDTITVDFPGVKDRLIARGQTEYHKAQDHIVLLGKKTAEERVESFLYMVARSIGRNTEDDATEAPLPMPRQDIADYLGLRLETLSRTLALLKKKGSIRDLERHRVTLAG
ncbi:MAG TPA: Crp/Fnr family transcriptional regulator [Parvularcula sp.]|nr:Crp/Fnr family transcriptional regulator [Parvularcula sp.]HBS32374.1 Crp/Fnr family transcriptional regulator [Parvularcula sp.]